MNKRDPAGQERPAFQDLLVTHRAKLLRFVERNAAWLLQREAAEDLVQGIHLRAIEVRDRFSYRSDAEFFAWLTTIARQHFADRTRYWLAQRRDAGKVFRISVAASRTTAGSAVDPSAPGDGPLTHAARHDEIDFVMAVFPKLFPRDRALLDAVAKGHSIATIADTLGLSEETARKARLRALERFRLAVEVVAKRSRRD